MKHAFWKLAQTKDGLKQNLITETMDSMQNVSQNMC